MIDYTSSPMPPSEDQTALDAIRIIRTESSSDSEVLKALETLTKYMKGV